MRRPRLGYRRPTPPPRATTRRAGPSTLPGPAHSGTSWTGRASPSVPSKRATSTRTSSPCSRPTRRSPESWATLREGRPRSSSRRGTPRGKSSLSCTTRRSSNSKTLGPCSAPQGETYTRPLRFAIAGDPVSHFDRNSRTTMKAPDFSGVLAAKNAVEAWAAPTPENVLKASTSNFDPVLGLHGMSGSYSSPSGPLDFLKSAVEGVAVARTAGLLAPAAAAAV